MGLKRSFSSKFTDSEKSLAILPAGFKLVPGASGVAFIWGDSEAWGAAHCKTEKRGY